MQDERYNLTITVSHEKRWLKTQKEFVSINEIKKFVLHFVVKRAVFLAWCVRDGNVKFLSQIDRLLWLLNLLLQFCNDDLPEAIYK